MSEIRKDGAPFVGYEYKEVDCKGPRASMYLDCYPCFGWTEDERTKNGTITLKRDRKLVNKVELTRLQRHFEACMNEIETLERSKTTGAMIAALSVGIIGCAFMAGSVFAVTHEPPLLALTIVLAVPGFVGWILPWFVYRKLAAKRGKAVAELVEKTYDEIYEICDKGAQLL